MAGQYDEDLVIAKRMFIGGFFGLPLLWFFMACHYWPISKRPDAPAMLKNYVQWALAGSSICFAAFIAWVVYFQLNWDTSEALYKLLVVRVPIPNSNW